MGLFHLPDDALFPLLHLFVDIAVDLETQRIIEGYHPKKIDKQGDRQ
jgi:hypothetical protein